MFLLFFFLFLDFCSLNYKICFELKPASSSRRGHPLIYVIGENSVLSGSDWLRPLIGERTTGLKSTFCERGQDQRYFSFLLHQDAQVQRNLQALQYGGGSGGWRGLVPLHSGLKATLDEAPDSSDGPGVSLMFPPVYEGDEAGSVQAALCSGATVSRTGL